MSFPTSPNPGDLWTENGIQFVYVTTPPPPRWDRTAAVPTGDRYQNNYSGTTWLITHNLNQQYVSWQAVDGAGNTVMGDPTFTSANVLTLTFNQAVTGTAIIRK